MKNKLIIGDLHQKFNNLNNIAPLFGYINSLIKDKGINEVIFLGDVYDTKAVIRSEVQNFFIEKLNELCKNDVKIFIIVGNHDYENQDCKNHSLRPLSFISDKIVIVDSPKLGDDNIGFLPYYPTNDLFKAGIKELMSRNKKINYIYCHQGFLGFDYGNGFLDNHSQSADDVPKNIKFICGHYHKTQKSDNVFYLGTPMSHSFGEVDQAKFIAIQSGDNFDMLPTADIVPRHVRFYVDSESSNIALSNVKAADHIEVIVSCKKSEMTKFDKEWLSGFFDATFTNVTVKFDITEDSQNVRIKEHMTAASMLEKYLESKGQTHLLAMGSDILEDAAL